MAAVIMQDYAQAFAYVAALTGGDPNITPMQWRAIHDTDKGAEAFVLHGTLQDCWQALCAHQANGFGIFAEMNVLHGGRRLEHVQYIRAHAADLDDISAQQNYERAAVWQPAPTFAVQSSPGKFHIYWCVVPYVGNDRYTTLQRKLRQLFQGDPKIIDPTRVLRVPGFLHLKNPSAPFVVQCWALGGYGGRWSVDQLEAATASINVIEGGSGRYPLGSQDLAAPSLEWLTYAMSLVDPNTLDRGEWVSMSAAIRQSGSTLTDTDTLHRLWSEWCARYDSNDPAENDKQWRSFEHGTQLGWPSLMARVPSLRAMATLGQPTTPAQAPAPGEAATPPMPANEPPALDCNGYMLTHIEQQTWFRGVSFINNLGLMMTADGRFLNATQFNVVYGGKKFIIDEQSKVTDEAWKAATRSTLWQVPKVDHIRFLPDRLFGEVILDDRGRKGVNTYSPAVVDSAPGDVSLFLRHVELMLPVEADRKILLDFLAHNVRYPGHKIPWAPVIQSVEGVGKGVLKLVMKHCIGRSYTYFPNAQQLSGSGSTFNAWLRNKLFILVDEIKVDEKRELIEILKPLISEKENEIQSKGVDQDIEDTFANWCFFTNWKDAIPLSKNGRRYAIFYSPIQTVEDLLMRGMDDAYFNRLYGWLESGGARAVAYYLLHYPIERGAIPMRAPDTSSMGEAIKLSRGPIERMIAEAVEDAIEGFRGGWVSVIAVQRRMRDTGIRAVSVQVVETILTTMGYVSRGRAVRPYLQEDRNTRAALFSLPGSANVADYGRAQGYPD